jgi:hypothetical protein
MSDTEEQSSLVAYPMLQEKAFVPPPEVPRNIYNASAVAQPMILETRPEPEEPVETESKRRWADFLPSAKWFLKKPQNVAKESLWTGVEEQPAAAVSPDFVPTPLMELAKRRAPVIELIRAGATKQSFDDGQLSVDDFYRNGYTLYDLNKIIPSFEALIESGFSKYHLTGQWYLDHICTLYDKTKPEVCMALGFCAEDFVRTNILPKDMATMGITGDVLVSTLKLNFASLFSFKIEFEDFVDTFRFSLENVRALKLNRTQKEALSIHRGWTPVKFKKKYNLSVSEVQTEWMLPEPEF